jgi:hypothetical protein
MAGSKFMTMLVLVRRSVCLLDNQNSHGMTRTFPCITRGLACLLVLAFFAQCEKEDPSTEAAIETTLALQTNAALQGKLTVEQAYVHAIQIDMVAKRTDGSQFTFSASNPEEDKKVRLQASGTTPFNIPAQQGKYDPIDVTVTLQEDVVELSVTPGAEGAPPVVDYAAFLANAKPSIAFSGKFNNRGQSTRVYIALNIGDRLHMQATQLGKSTVALSKENRAKFTVDPAWILQDITTAEIESAISFEYLGEKTILIHQDFNADLYEQIVERLFEDETGVKVELIQLGTKG